MAIEVTSLKPEQEQEAAQLLARAFVTNPLHVAVFGDGALSSNETFFRMGLAAMKGPKLAALEGTQLLGMTHFIGSPACRFPASEKLRVFPLMVKALGLRTTLKLVDWLSCWGKHDPEETHLHLGPIGVDPEAQGRGVGRLLMEQYCAELDRKGLAGYLETDRPGNVEFYKRFGFEVIGTATILGVENFFMSRATKR
jgi:ribosomal protein S18 acetylase RimI-like enzyme